MLTPTSTDEQIREIKRQFRKAMNGIVAASMREKGMDYRVNFGLTLPLLKRIASTVTPDKALAQRLWEEPVRESKLLATWLYPAEDMEVETARQWVGTIPYTEVADLCCMNLFSRIAGAAQLAADCTTADDELTRYTGYQLWSRLLAQKYTPTDEEARHLISDYIDLVRGTAPAHLLAVATGCMKRLAAVSPQRAAEIQQRISTAEVPDTRRALLADIDEECRFLQGE